ncbi:MAG: LVIVD repeat-containing protein [Actinomycetes bacterium]
MDDSAADLAVDEEASSPNMHLVSNTPKSGIAAGESSFNSDLAFKGKYAYQGNYNGISVWDVSENDAPSLVSQIDCAGSQNDVSVYKNLLVTSTDSSRNKAECAGNVPQTAENPASWEGIRIFDISNPASPQYVTAVETDCGSHTHTTIPDAANDRAVVYVSSYSPNANFPDCQPPHDKISVVEIPDSDPSAASVVSEPVLFPDGGFPGIPGTTSATSGCHDITAYPAKGIAAGACMGEGVIMDISDLENPVVTDSVTDPNFAFWHSATFNNDATKVVFTDELGGGGGPTCNPTVGPNKGADAIYTLSPSGELTFASYFKIPRVNTNEENCVAHNGSLIPVPGKDIMVQSWYQGGVSVWDFTDASNPVEIAWFERGPLSTERLILGGSWSAYWYNGAIYSSDIQKGFDVLKVNDKRLGKAAKHRTSELNVQTQQPY